MSTTTTTATNTMTVTVNDTPDYKKGEHYIELESPIKHMPPVVVFFSFVDATSKKWALEHNIVGTIRKQVPMGTEVSRYHSTKPYPKELGEDLNHAWAVARSLQIDDKVLAPLFEAIHGQTRVTDMQGVKLVFDQVGIPPLRFDREYAKTSVKVDSQWMDECRQRLDIKTIPALVVSGRYLVQPEAFGDGFDAERVADLIKELLELK